MQAGIVREMQENPYDPDDIDIEDDDVDDGE